MSFSRKSIIIINLHYFPTSEESPFLCYFITWIALDTIYRTYFKHLLLAESQHCLYQGWSIKILPIHIQCTLVILPLFNPPPSPITIKFPIIMYFMCKLLSRYIASLSYCQNIALSKRWWYNKGVLYVHVHTLVCIIPRKETFVSLNK